MNSSAHAALRGRWKSILIAEGVQEKYLTGRQAPCPICGGKDRFRFDDKEEGRWFCNHCGAGDGFNLLTQLRGYDFTEALRVARKHAGAVAMDSIRTRIQQSDQQKIDTQHRAWVGCGTPGVPDCLAYLATRGLKLGDLHLEDALCLGWHPRLRATDDGQYAPALVARYYQWDAEMKPQQVTLQRMWPSLRLKKVMPSPIKMNGVFCPLGGQPTDILGVTEGVITALSARALKAAKGTHLPVWACYSAEQMTRFVPPKSVKTLIIFMDVDTSFTGQAAAYELARRLRVSYPDLVIRVQRPVPTDTYDHDFNDMLMDANLNKPEFCDG